MARRLRNLDRDQRVTILAGFYDEDWPKVWRFGLRGPCLFLSPFL